MHPCFSIKNDKVTCKPTGKQIVVAILATYRLCKSPTCRAYGVKMKPGNCLSRTRCIKYVENIHRLLDPKDLEEALADPKAHVDSLEESKARKHGIETRSLGQSTLDECVEEFGRRNVEAKRCMTNLACLCAVENLYLHMWT